MARDPRQASFFKRNIGPIFTVALAMTAVFYVMDSHLEYTNDNNKGADNPGGYLAYGLNKANNDIGAASTKVGQFSDRVTAAIEGKPAPEKQEMIPLNQRMPSLKDYYVNICLPRNLVEENSWENPAPGSKMESFRSLITDFILATGDRSIQYRIREGAFESYQQTVRNPNPRAFIAEVDARQDCPPSNYSARLLVPAR